MSAPTANDARLTLMAAFHLLSCLRARALEQLGAEEGNEISFAIDGVQKILSQADDEYESAFRDAMHGAETLMREKFAPIAAAEAHLSKVVSVHNDNTISGPREATIALCELDEAVKAMGTSLGVTRPKQAHIVAPRGQVIDLFEALKQSIAGDGARDVARGDAK